MPAKQRVGQLGQQLRALADYVVALAVTQPSTLERCAELPSIIDLIAPGCAAIMKPESITAGDSA